MTYPQPVKVLYTNWKGETRVREIKIVGLRFDSTEYHKEPQWLLQCADVKKGKMRDFALKDCNFDFDEIGSEFHG